MYFSVVSSSASGCLPSCSTLTVMHGQLPARTVAWVAVLHTKRKTLCEPAVIHRIVESWKNATHAPSSWQSKPSRSSFHQSSGS